MTDIDDCPMHHFHNPDQPAVQAIYVQTDAQRKAYAVVDALDALEHQLGACRALQQLTAINGASGAESLERLEQVKRSDLAMLLGVVNASLEAGLARAREAAVSSAKGG